MSHCRLTFSTMQADKLLCAGGRACLKTWQARYDKAY